MSFRFWGLMDNFDVIKDSLLKSWISSHKVLPNLTCSLSIKTVASGATGNSAFVPSVSVIRKLSKTVDGSSHSDAESQLMVMVFTPAGDAELTFVKVVEDLRACTYEPWGVEAKFQGTN